MAIIGRTAQFSTALRATVTNYHGVPVELLTGFVDDAGHVI